MVNFMTSPNHDEETTARERDNARGLPPAAQLADKDAMRAELTKIEDAVLRSFGQINGDARWMALARTHTELGFMCAKRALYQGKRVGDP
jgi:hypothetical protein